MTNESSNLKFCKEKNTMYQHAFLMDHHE